jgi:hypothetical protein
MFNHYNSGSKLPDWLHLETKHPIHEDLALKSWLIIFLLSHQHDKRWVSHMQSQSLYVFQDYAVCILLSFCLESPCSWLTPQLILLQTWGFAYKLANSIHGFSFNITSSSLHVTRCSWLWELQVLIQSLEEIRVCNWLPTPARGHLLVGFHAVKGPEENQVHLKICHLIPDDCHCNKYSRIHPFSQGMNLVYDLQAILTIQCFQKINLELMWLCRKFSEFWQSMLSRWGSKELLELMWLIACARNSQKSNAFKLLSESGTPEPTTPKP